MISTEAYWGILMLVVVAVGIYGLVISRPSKKDSHHSNPTMAFDSKPKGL